VCNTACFLASRLGRTEVTQADLVAAVEQTKYGRVYEAGRFISPGRKQRFAVVESGYCLAAALLPAIEPIDYVTILPSIKSTVGRTVLKVGAFLCQPLVLGPMQDGLNDAHDVCLTG
jgi:ATP-dependent Zn protease